MAPGGQGGAKRARGMDARESEMEKRRKRDGWIDGWMGGYREGGFICTHMFSMTCS